MSNKTLFGPNSIFTEATKTKRNTFTISYDGTTITFPAPLMGNRLRVERQLIKRETIRKAWVSYRDPNWNEIQAYRYTFDHVERSVTDSWLTFISDSLGQPVTVVDQNTITRTGIIVEPETPVAYNGDDDQCKDTVEVVLRWI